MFCLFQMLIILHLRMQQDKLLQALKKENTIQIIILPTTAIGWPLFQVHGRPLAPSATLLLSRSHQRERQGQLWQQKQSIFSCCRVHAVRWLVPLFSDPTDRSEPQVSRCLSYRTRQIISNKLLVVEESH